MIGSIFVFCSPLYVWNFSYRITSPFFFPCLIGPWNPLETSLPSRYNSVRWWTFSGWIIYIWSSHNLLSCTRMIRNIFHRATSSVVPKIGRSPRCIIVELNRLMNFGFETNYMPPMVSQTKSQNMVMFIYGNNTWSIKSRSKSFTCSVFPLTSLKISIVGSYDSSGIAYLGDELWPPINLDMITMKCW